MDLIYGAPPQTPAAMCRSSFRGQTSKNNKINPPRNRARFRAINESTKTQTANLNPIITKTKKSHKTSPVLAPCR